MALVEVSDLTKGYKLGDATVHALQGASFAIEAGTFVVIMGPSGSGKSTLLHLLGGLDTPDRGSVVVDGSDLSRLSDDELTTFRRERMGFIFQFFNLLPTMTAWENVALVRLLAGKKLSDQKGLAGTALNKVGLGDRADHKPSQLSGGEMQRVAIARALMGDPSLILADEPTGNLDSASGGEVLRLLRRAVTDDGKTVVMVTHESRAADIGDKVLHLVDGRLAQ